MMESSKRSLFTMLPLLLLASLFLGACSGGGGDASSAGTPPAASPPPSTPPSTPPPSTPPQVVAQLVQQGYVKASNTNADDYFGLSVALSGDTLVVGAPHEGSSATGINGNQADNNAPNSGAVYVFTRTAGVWTQQAYLKASNTEAGDEFGINIVLSGDTLAVGALGEGSGATGVNGNQADNTAPTSGAVYVFTRTAGVWAQEAYLKASNHAGAFGYSLALKDDTLAVGAPFEWGAATGVNGDQFNNSAPEAGAVYVFTRTTGVWSQEAYLKASNTDAGDRFGPGLGLDGDTLVVGARLEASAASGVNADQTNNGAPLAGAVYVFTRSAGVWSQQAYLKASNAGADKNFGGSVAISGDLVAVGSRLEDSNATGIDGNQTNNNAPDSGAVYLFTRNGGVWTQKAYLKASNTNAGDQFGVFIALSGTTLAVGAVLEDSNAIGVNANQGDNSAQDSGAVYVFDEL